MVANGFCFGDRRRLVTEDVAEEGHHNREGEVGVDEYSEEADDPDAYGLE